MMHGTMKIKLIKSN